MPPYARPVELRMFTYAAKSNQQKQQNTKKQNKTKAIEVGSVRQYYSHPESILVRQFRLVERPSTFCDCFFFFFILPDSMI